MISENFCIREPSKPQLQITILKIVGDYIRFYLNITCVIYSYLRFHL
jgi:hypothetical protein